MGCRRRALCQSFGTRLEFAPIFAFRNGSCLHHRYNDRTVLKSRERLCANQQHQNSFGIILSKLLMASVEKRDEISAEAAPTVS